MYQRNQRASRALPMSRRDDAHEREARRVAEKVVRTGPTAALRVPGGASGQPLPDPARAFFEKRLGHDFAKVRIHADERAASSARELGADAYTIGNDVVFGAGRFAPETTEGQRLLAHELAHTIQQRGQPLAVARQESAAPLSIRKRFKAGPEVTFAEDKQNRTVKIFVDGVLVAELTAQPGESTIQVESHVDPATGAFELNIAVTPNVDVRLSPAGKKLKPNITSIGQAAPVTLEKPDPELGGRFKPGPVEVPREPRAPKAQDLSGVTEAEIQKEEEPDGVDLAKIGIAVGDVVTDFVPIVSNIKDALTALTGVNPVTGEEVGVLGRILAGIFAIPGLGNILKYIGKGGKLLIKGIQSLPKVLKAIWKGLVWVWRKLEKPLIRARDWTAEKAKNIWEAVTARLGRKKPKATTPEPPAEHTKLSQPGGLKSTEGTQITRDAQKKLNSTSKKASHVLKEHGPDLTDDYLQQRLTGKGAVEEATKFLDRATMETVIGEAIEKRQADIAAWLSEVAGKVRTKGFSYKPGRGNIGRGFRLGADGQPRLIEEALDEVEVVLRSDGHGGYIIQSAFPMVAKP